MSMHRLLIFINKCLYKYVYFITDIIVLMSCRVTATKYWQRRIFIEIQTLASRLHIVDFRQRQTLEDLSTGAIWFASHMT